MMNEAVHQEKEEKRIKKEKQIKNEEQIGENKWIKYYFIFLKYIKYYMSNPQTFYTVGGVDLSNIFQPHSGTSQALPTGYKIPPNGDDLNTIFLPYPGPPATQAPLTNYNVNGVDLNAIFSPYIPSSYVITGTGNYSQLISGYNVVTFINNGTIIFTTPSTIPFGYMIVGGGGSGGETTDQNTAAGGGGVGGGVNYASFANSITSLTSNVTYNITIGSGGVNGNGTNSTLDSLLSASGGTTGSNSTGLSTPGIITSIAGGGTTTSGFGGAGAVEEGNGPSFTVEIGSYSFSGGGGGGSNSPPGGAPGFPGGGNGGNNTNAAINGQPNTGGGGGGAYRINGTIGANGGSGIVILFFL